MDNSKTLTARYVTDDIEVMADARTFLVDLLGEDEGSRQYAEMVKALDGVEVGEPVDEFEPTHIAYVEDGEVLEVIPTSEREQVTTEALFDWFSAEQRRYMDAQRQAFSATAVDRQPTCSHRNHSRARRAAPTRTRGSRRSSVARSGAASGDPSHRCGDPDDGEPVREHLACLTRSVREVTACPRRSRVRRYWASRCACNSQHRGRVQDPPPDARPNLREVVA